MELYKNFVCYIDIVWREDLEANVFSKKSCISYTQELCVFYSCIVILH